jgi:hypothetical protein
MTMAAAKKIPAGDKAADGTGNADEEASSR